VTRKHLRAVFRRFSGVAVRKMLLLEQKERVLGEIRLQEREQAQQSFLELRRGGCRSAGLKTA